MKQNAPVGGVVHDGIEALAQLVNRLVQQHFRAAVFFEFSHHPEATRGGVGQLRARAGVQHLVSRPFAPLHAVHRAEVVRAFAIRIGDPLRVLVGIRVPYLAAEIAEVRSAARGAQKADQLAHRRLECQLLGRHGGEALLEIEAQHRARHADGADAGAVLLPRAGVENRADEVQILFHAGSFDEARAQVDARHGD